MPPWAKRVFESAAAFLVTTATLAPDRAARMAKYRPAMPLPTTT